MFVRYACSAGAAAVFTIGIAAAGQTSQPAQSSPQVNDRSGSPITLVGCVQRESDYRRANDAGRGGAAATGLGLGNEFVLVNASVVSSATAGSAPAAAGDCSSATGGEAYELTGSHERELASMVGRRVEVSGMLKRAATTVGTSGTTDTAAARPTGGFDPLKQDLRLYEVEIMSFREASAVAAQAPTPAPPADVAQAPEPSQPARVATTGNQEQLPRTASPLALAGLTGLLSLCGAVGVRSYRRRTR